MYLKPIRSPSFLRLVTQPPVRPTAEDPPQRSKDATALIREWYAAPPLARTIFHNDLITFLHIQGIFADGR